MRRIAIIRCGWRITRARSSSTRRRNGAGAVHGATTAYACDPVPMAVKNINFLLKQDAPAAAVRC